MTTVEIRPGDETRAAIAKLRKGEKEIRLSLNKGIRNATKPAATALKGAVMGLESKGTRGGGGAQRSDHLQGRSKKGRLPKNTGLRANISRGIQTKITYSGVRTGVRIRADSQYLPPNQKVLVKATNRGKVRHPVFHDRDTWVYQTFKPKGWFDETMKRQAPQIIANIDNAARDAMKKLQ